MSKQAAASVASMGGGYKAQNIGYARERGTEGKRIAPKVSLIRIIRIMLIKR